MASLCGDKCKEDLFSGICAYKNVLTVSVSAKYSRNFAYRHAMRFGGKMLVCFIFRLSQNYQFRMISSVRYMIWIV